MENLQKNRCKGMKKEAENNFMFLHKKSGNQVTASSYESNQYLFIFYVSQTFYQLWLVFGVSIQPNF